MQASIMTITVSVIIPTHNRVKLLRRAVQSVLAQSMQDIEVIIVNDASTDDTEYYLLNLVKTDARVQFISNPQSQGGSQSRNSGIAASKGEWIAFLDDDDTWLPEKLTLQLQAMQDNPDAVAASCAYAVNYPLRIKKNIFPPNKVSYETLLKANCLGGASVCFCNAATLKKIGGFDAKLRSSQDWDLWIKLREAGEIIAVSTILVEYYIHFDYRISNDMRAKYVGARRFYFKYRDKMDSTARLSNIAFLAFIKSRQSKRGFFCRLKYLRIAMTHTSFRTARAYFISSLPRILLQPFS
jgi:glycosyltransferase involved in cell wall biosynthesis